MAYSTSQKYKNAIRQSGNRKTVVDLYYNRQTTPILTDIPVYSGSLSVSQSSATRRSGTCTLGTSTLITESSNITLEPYGVEIGIRMGVTFVDGTEELVPVGKFLITDVEWNDETGSVPTITFADRSQTINDQSSQTGSEDYGGKGTFFAIINLLEKSPFLNVTDTFDTLVDPLSLTNQQLNVVIDSTLTDQKIPTGSPMTTPFWDEIQTLAGNLGAEAFFYVDGCNVIVRTIPSIDMSTLVSDAVATVDSGPAGILLTADHTLSRQNSYNAVQATGALPANASSTAVPPTVFVYDTNPASKTYYWGPFGRKVYQMTSDTITDPKQLKAAAKAQLAKLVGLNNGVSLTMLTDPSLDAGDIIYVKFFDGTTGLYLIDTMSIDLGWSTPMSVTTIAPNQL